MNLSTPLATVAPTLDADVLHVLAATTGWCTAAEVHRRVGSHSDEGVRKVLSRLVGQGVVQVDTPTRYPVYRLNREHVAVPHIVALTRVRDDIVKKIQHEVASWLIQALHVGLFGSFARGTADADSDIDVLLIRPESMNESDESIWSGQIGRLYALIQAWTGNEAQVIDLSPTTLSDMARANDPLFLSWRAEDIPLHGARLLDVVRRGR